MLNPGDLIFVGWDGDNEDVAFVTTSAIPGGEVIYFTDSEWTGTQFRAGEQLIEWTVPPEGIAAGSVLTLDMIPGGGATVTETGSLSGDVSGSVDYIQGGGFLASTNEMMWAFQGTRSGDDVTPENFISVIGNEADGGIGATPNLANTGLTPQNGAIVIDGDHDYMSFQGFGSLPDPSSAQGAIEAISDLSNWVALGPGRNGTDDNPLPDGGFALTSPVLFDADDVTTLYFDGAHVAFIDDISSPDGDVTSLLQVSDQPFLPTDLIEIDILNSSLRPDGEFDFDEVIFTRVSVTRGGVTYDFQVSDGSKVKESGATETESGQAVEQGDTFFVTNDDVNSLVRAPLGAGPFSGVPSGRLAFSLNETFVDGGVTAIVREQTVTDDAGDVVGIENANFYYASSLVPPPIPCFAAGTRLTTSTGPRPVEELEVGDLVVSRDSGLVPVRWIGRRRVRARGAFAPIRFRAHALGNDRDLLVSPNHKVLLTGWRAQLLFGEEEVLVAAKHLINDRTIVRETRMIWVEYYHILLDSHGVIYAEGCPAESLDPQFLQDWADDVSTDARFAALYSELRPPAQGANSVGPIHLKRHEGQLLK